MGYWGTGIFDNDTACDIRARFQRFIVEGIGMEEIIQRCIEGFPEPMEDISVVLALAALQIEQRCLMPTIRQLAISLIEQEDINSWKDPEKRLRDISAFKQKLLQH
ncbi:DUF4259 domain-containing protein [Paenibacillus sp. y28]|uniref:DUF4259 domain-containing protein n=1 Tax=Paenibacillus sp. y28 TaxID=3129110 RepID=UPI00301B2DA2